MAVDIQLYADVNDCSTTVFSKVLTANLVEMARFCRVYDVLWHARSSQVAGDLLEHLIPGLRFALENPESCKRYNPPNGFGTYESFVEFLKEYVLACVVYPEAKISIS